MDRPRSADGSDPQDPAEALCMACGACCRGLIFSTVIVHDDELEKPARFSLPIHPYKDEQTFKQPCTFHADGKCSIYQERFRACESYRCLLLKRMLKGKLTLEESLEVVSTAKRLEERIYAQIGGRDASKDIMG